MSQQMRRLRVPLQHVLPCTVVSLLTLAGSTSSIASEDCTGDLDGDATVGGPDLTILLADWGSPGDSDLDGSGTVEGADVGILLGHWGECNQDECRPGWLTTDGKMIVDCQGNEVRLQGVNWFGFEGESNYPLGLYARGLNELVQHIAELGFNCVRLPFSLSMLSLSNVPTPASLEAHNVDLSTMSPLQILDEVISECAEQNLMVILDCHRLYPPSASGGSKDNGLWYEDDGTYTEDFWIANWVSLAERYKNDPTVIGCDLWNEPHGQAWWGGADDMAPQNWRRAAEKAGNAILEVNPNLLIIVEGVECVPENGGPCGSDDYDDYYWWGGNLTGAQDNPVILTAPDQLVYSIHDYGTSVHCQSWLGPDSSVDWPENLNALWDQRWGYLLKQDIAPILVGEFGSCLSTLNVPQYEGCPPYDPDVDIKWIQQLIQYISDNGASFTYWCFNASNTSPDTGGLLCADDTWATVDNERYCYVKPLLDTGDESVDCARTSSWSCEIQP